MPTLRLKLIATALSGALMGMAGAPLPYYIGYVEPSAAFGLPYAVNSIAMPMIGGTTSWVGPLVGAILLGTLQQVATVTISSVVNLLIVGVLLVAFVIAAPVGIVGLMQEFLRTAAPSRLNTRSIAGIAIASYCFIAGILAIIFNLPALQMMHTAAVWFGLAGVIVGAMTVTAAYGLLKLQPWAPLLASLALCLTIVLAALHMYIDGSGYVLHSIRIAVGVVSLWFLQASELRTLYGSEPRGQAVAA